MSAAEDVKQTIGDAWPFKQTAEDREVSFTLTHRSMQGEALALMTGLPVENFDIHAEGRALVDGILERKKASDGGV